MRDRASPISDDPIHGGARVNLSSYPNQSEAWLYVGT